MAEYRIGQYFKIKKSPLGQGLYMIVRTGFETSQLINVISGSRWTEAKPTRTGTSDITQAEFDKLTAGKSHLFERVVMPWEGTND